jgi:DNA-binding PadR family transcriptional regulator
MSHDDWAAPWPLLGRIAAMKSAARGRHGRYGNIDDLERLAALRQMRGGPFWGPPPGGPFGGGRGRRRRGDVRAAVLILLAEEPRNGYQLMQAIEERSGGRWRPSPGSVYPALSQLEDEGLIRSTDRDGAKLFEITDAGREQIGNREGQAPPWEMEDDPAFEAAGEFRSLIHQLALATMQVVGAGNEDQMRRAREALTETRRTLYRILAEDEAPPAGDGG